MRNQLFDIARDPSCILAVTPHFGGSWVSPLRPGEGNPWPSPTPRNFASEPATWYNAKAWFESAPTGNMTFDFEFEQLSIPVAGQTYLFSTGGRAPFACEWIIASEDRFAFRINFQGLYDVSSIPNSYLQVIFNASTIIGKHTVHAEAADGLFTVTMDGTTVSDTRIGARLNGTFTGVLRTTADCNISRLSIATPGYPKFSYPSEAERVWLLTYDNVRTDRGVFEAADWTRAAKIRTQLTGAPETLIALNRDGSYLLNPPMASGVYSLTSGQQVRALIGFDRALKPAEIAAISQC